MHEDRKQTSGCQGLGRAGGGGLGGRGIGLLFVVMEMFWKEVEVMTAQWSEDTKTHWIAHFKMADFMLHELHLN